MCFGIAILLRCLNMMVGAKTIDRVRHRQSSEEEFVVETGRRRRHCVGDVYLASFGYGNFPSGILP